MFKPIDESLLNLLFDSSIDQNDFKISFQRDGNLPPRKKYFVSTTCGLCGLKRYVMADRICSKVRSRKGRTGFTGLCQSCSRKVFKQEYTHGGRYSTESGYTTLALNSLGDADKEFASSMSQKNEYGSRIPEHRLVMAKHIGRPLTKDETVHHIDGNRSHNDITNLRLYTGKHGKGHDGYYQEYQEALKDIKRLQGLLEAK